MHGWQAIAQDAPRDCPKAVSPNGNVVPPVLVKLVRPEYSRVAKEKLVDGDVILDIVIATDGSVRNITPTHGLPDLTRLAVLAVSQWRFEPARFNGVAIPCKTTIRQSFQLIADHAAYVAAETEVAQAEARVRASAENPGVKPILPPPPEGVLRISAKAMGATLEKRVEPVYPEDAIALNARGVVTLLVTVTKTGEVGDVQTLSGPDRFHEAAVAAVRQWKYKPYEVDGDARDVQTIITLNFAPPAH